MICSTCKVSKPKSQFSKSALERGRGSCLGCSRKAVRKSYYKHHQDRIRKSREYRKNNPDAGRNAKFQYKYGISLDKYNELLKSQNGCCAICNENSLRYLDVDHSHSTKAVRGLLCRQCNLGIGSFKDDPRLLHRAVLYLESKS